METVLAHVCRPQDFRTSQADSCKCVENLGVGEGGIHNNYYYEYSPQLICTIESMKHTQCKTECCLSHNNNLLFYILYIWVHTHVWFVEFFDQYQLNIGPRPSTRDRNSAIPIPTAMA